MGSPRQNSSLVHDPLGLLALPMTTTDDGPRPGTHNAKSLGMVLTALVVVFIMINLVSLPALLRKRKLSRTVIWKSDEGCCQACLSFVVDFRPRSRMPSYMSKC